MPHSRSYWRDDDANSITLRKPDPSHGAAILSLIQDCKPLDENSLYFYLIQCEHFRDTCVLAEREGEVVGWLSAHIPPRRNSAVFVWQVAVSPEVRGEGLGLRMLEELIRRPECADADQLCTTITADNQASWALFRKFAARRGATVEDAPHYLAQAHFNGAHKTEYLVTISIAEPREKAA